MTLKVSRFLFPDKSPFYLTGLLRKVEGVRDFQENVMSKSIKSILDQTSDGLEISGIENLRKIKGGYVVISNHRDIVMDPSILEYALFSAGMPLTELCVGSNLLSVGYVRNLMRSNRMIKVMRGLPARGILESSKVLSAYIRNSVRSDGRPVWIAQREGRAKDSLDATEQAVLKMLDMSGDKSFVDNWLELPVVPMSISYEYESCDALRARELYIRKHQGSYTKRKGEDLNSILTGIRQYKGKVHIHFCEPLGKSDIEAAAELKGNLRYKSLCAAIDAKINGSYAIWNTNIIAAALLNGNNSDLSNVRSAVSIREILPTSWVPSLFGSQSLPNGHDTSKISSKEIQNFKDYIERKLDTVMSKEIDRAELREILLHIYSNPILRNA